jgi:hypothetical protein
MFVVEVAPIPGDLQFIARQLAAELICLDRAISNRPPTTPGMSMLLYQRRKLVNEIMSLLILEQSL